MSLTQPDPEGDVLHHGVPSEKPDPDGEKVVLGWSFFSQPKLAWEGKEEQSAGSEESSHVTAPFSSDELFSRSVEDNDTNDSRAGRDTEQRTPQLPRESHPAGVRRSDGSKEPSAFSARWTRLVNRGRAPFMRGMLFTTDIAARYPKSTISMCVVLAIASACIGYATNFNLSLDEDVLWTPKGCRPLAHLNWLEEESGYDDSLRFFAMFFHGEGSNILSKDTMASIFELFDGVKSIDGYDEMCLDSGFTNQDNVTTCRAFGSVKFFNFSKSVFEAEVKSDEDAISALSATYYPDGTIAVDDINFGFPVRDIASGYLTSVQSFTVFIAFPDTAQAESFESDALDLVLGRDDAWEADPETNLRVEVFAERAFADELQRGIVADLPLVPLVFIVMSLFTCIVFYKRDPVRSQSLLGASAVLSVMFSILFAYGLLWTIGVTFTPMTQLLPFIIFGIGLDDAFIIMGAYNRLDPDKNPVEKIRETVEDVGLSITLTTLTSALAFGLGGLSSLPAISWLCIYAFPAIIFDYCYQLTFFVACVVLDDRRIQQRRRDICTWITVPDDDKGAAVELTSEAASPGRQMPFVDRIMVSYASFLLRPWVKAVVLAFFAALLGGFAYSTSLLQQAFDVTKVLPEDSYVTDFLDANKIYTDLALVNPFLYFRDVDQSDKLVQQQMEDFIDEVAQLDFVMGKPDFFWLWDFNRFLNETEGVDQYDFNVQLDMFLSDPIMNQLYGENIVRDMDGSILTSRTWVRFQNIGLNDVNNQIDALLGQREVAARQPINKGKSNWSFFMFQSIFLSWEFFTESVRELTISTITSVISIAVVSITFIPHWSAVLFVIPLITVLYIDLMGVLQLAGIAINGVSFLALVMAIGLLVDFILHVLLRYYESPGSRREKTVDMLRTMGSSLLVGGLSTFLGVVPLVFSSSEIFNTIFISFFGLVSLGMGHGLILMPVVLSMIGTEEHISLRLDGKAVQPPSQEQSVRKAETVSTSESSR